MEVWKKGDDITISPFEKDAMIKLFTDGKERSGLNCRDFIFN